MIGEFIRYVNTVFTIKLKVTISSGSCQTFTGSTSTKTTTFIMTCISQLFATEITILGLIMKTEFSFSVYG